jgi:hypothetical protein
MIKQKGNSWLFLVIVSILLLLACSKDNNPVKPPTLLAPMLVVPLNSAVGQTLPLKLKWTAVNEAAMYELQISTSNAFSSLVQDDSTITADSTSVSGLSGSTTYYWRVRAKNSATISPWTNPWSFTTYLTTPGLVNPGNGAINQPITPTLTWNMVKGALTYRVQVSTAATFSSTVVDDSAVIDTLKNISTLSYSKTYYWRVRAKNNGDTSTWSGVWSFSTMQDPAFIAPTLYKPSNGATDQSLDLQLVWTTVNGAAVYELQIAKSDSFTNVIQDDSTLTAAFKTVTELSSNTTYYWRVRAKNATAASAWSNIYSFSTIVITTPVITIDAIGTINTGTYKNVTGSISADTAISSVSYAIVTDAGVSVPLFEISVTGPSASGGKTVNFTPPSPIRITVGYAVAGNYKLKILAAAVLNSEASFDFTVVGSTGTPVLTATVTLGSYANPTVGSSIDLDNGTVIFAAAAVAPGSGVDLVGTYSSNPSYMTLRLFTPVYARDNSNIPAFSAWPDAAATSIVKVTGTAFSAITTVEQIQPLYAAGTPVISVSCAQGDVLVVKTDQNRYVAIEVGAFDANTTGTFMLKYGR